MNHLSLATVAAIISDTIIKKLYKHVQKNIGEGYIYTVDLIGQWAVEFETKYGEVDWEDFQMNPTKYGFDESHCAWDDAVMSFAKKKFKELKGEVEKEVNEFTPVPKEERSLTHCVCPKCDKKHEYTKYALAQMASGVHLKKACDCGKNIVIAPFK